MKFTITTAIASLLALSIAAPAPDHQPITYARIVAESNEKAIGGKGIYGKHEGAGINYVFFGEPTDLYYNTTTNELSDRQQSASFKLGVYEGIATLSVLGDQATPILVGDDQYLTVNGSANTFAACKNINDPYRYSENEYVLTSYEEIPEDCISLKLKVDSLSSIL